LVVSLSVVVKKTIELNLEDIQNDWNLLTHL
jgi:hypothetical protein